MEIWWYSIMYWFTLPCWALYTVLVNIMFTLMDYCGIIYSPWNERPGCKCCSLVFMCWPRLWTGWDRPVNYLAHMMYVLWINVFYNVSGAIILTNLNVPIYIYIYRLSHKSITIYNNISGTVTKCRGITRQIIDAGLVKRLRFCIDGKGVYTERMVFCNKCILLPLVLDLENMRCTST
jgi:hypothetical protein